MSKKIILILAFIFAFSCLPLCAQAAENEELDVDDVTKLQNSISADIARLRPSVEKELEGFELDESSISHRIDEISVLIEKASDDMAAWGYTDDQREIRMRVLSELIAEYAAYAAMVNGNVILAEGAASVDVHELGAVAAPDIKMSDHIRTDILKVSRGLNAQVFYLQSKLSKLRLDLSETARLRKDLKEAEEGTKVLDIPRTYILEFESSRLNVALSYMQLRAYWKAFEQNVNEIQRLRGRLENIRPNITFSREVLDKTLSDLQDRLSSLANEMNDSRKALDSAHASLARAQANLGSADATPFTEAGSRYIARSVRVNYWEYMVSLLDDEIEQTKEAQQIWRNRYKLFHDEASGEEIWSFSNSSKARIDALERQLEGVNTMESMVLKHISDLQSNIAQEQKNAVITQNLLQALENYRKIIYDVFNRYESEIPNAMFLQRRLHEEAGDKMSAVRLAEKVTSFSYDTVMDFLDTELWQGEGYSVTVWKLTIAILVFLSSFFLSSLGSHWIKRRMISRFKAGVTAANAVQRIVFYILWVTFALIALNIVKIPLTAFAFLGGAIMVGLGFGMQNIFNNLISGFIVIFYHPFKLNDILEVGGSQGVVQDIGSRSTTIRTWDGFDMVLPNRYFLENSFTNWTKTDWRRRDVLKIGVSYDADSRQVEKILMDVAKGHSKVLDNPAPFVLFKDFGDDALEFELYFWTDLHDVASVKVASDMRHHILSVFNREGIGIPFPQRDIHIIPPVPTIPVAPAALEAPATQDETDKADAPDKTESQ